MLKTQVVDQPTNQGSKKMSVNALKAFATAHDLVSGYKDAYPRATQVEQYLLSGKAVHIGMYDEIIHEATRLIRKYSVQIKIPTSALSTNDDPAGDTGENSFPILRIASTMRDSLSKSGVPSFATTVMNQHFIGVMLALLSVVAKRLAAKGPPNVRGEELRSEVPSTPQTVREMIDKANALHGPGFSQKLMEYDGEGVHPDAKGYDLPVGMEDANECDCPPDRCLGRERSEAEAALKAGVTKH